MATRRPSKKARTETDSSDAPPFPGAEWGDEEEFKAFWGKSLDEVIEECEQAPESGRIQFDSGEEMLAYLRAHMKRRADV
jgi:hypothetical protein